MQENDVAYDRESADERLFTMKVGTITILLGNRALALGASKHAGQFSAITGSLT